MANTISINVIADVRKAAQGIDQINTKLSGIQGVGKKVGGALKGMAAGAAALAIGGGVADFAKDTIKSASDAQQSIGATETVFGKFSDTVIKTSKQASTAYGLSANEYRENANLIGSLFKNQGVSAGELAGKTDELVKKGADLSATFGGSATEAVAALGSAYKGEFDPLERYGISIKQSAVNAVLAAKGQDKLTGAAKAAAQQQAVTQLIMEQSSGSTGAFAKETDTLAHQQQVLSAKFTDAKAALGTALLPILTQFIKFVSDTALPAIQSFTGFLSDNKTTIMALVGVVGALFAIQKIHAAFMAVQAVGGLVAYIAQMNIVSMATKAWAAVQWVLNAAMSANPIGIVIIAIVALIAAIVLLWKNSETFRTIVIGAWNAVKTAAVAVFNFIKDFISAAWNAIKAVTSAVWNAIKAAVSAVFSAIKTVVMTYFNIYKTVITTAIDVIKTVFSKGFDALKTIVTKAFDAVKSVITGAVGGIKDAAGKIIDAIKGVFSGAVDMLKDIGKKIIQGLIDGINFMVKPLKDLLGKVTDWIPDWKGPASKDKKLLFGAGKLIMNGLVDGIDSQTGLLKRQLGDVSGIISGADMGSLTPGRLSFSGAGSGGNTFNVNVYPSPFADPVAVGKEVTKAIDAFRSAGGRV